MKTQILIYPLDVDIPAQEVEQYIDYLTRKHGRAPDRLTITVNGEFVDLDPVYMNPPFERIRRITGYLVGTTDRWNNAKRAEEHDRVKHGIGATEAKEGENG